MSEQCRSTRHCVGLGWCHRCDPRMGRLGSQINEALWRAGVTEEQRARLYPELTQLVHEWEREEEEPPHDPPRNLAELSRLQLMRLGRKFAANEERDRGESAD